MNSCYHSLRNCAHECLLRQGFDSLVRKIRHCPEWLKSEHNYMWINYMNDILQISNPVINWIPSAQIGSVSLRAHAHSPRLWFDCFCLWSESSSLCFRGWMSYRFCSELSFVGKDDFSLRLDTHWSIFSWNRLRWCEIFYHVRLVCSLGILFIDYSPNLQIFFYVAY